MVMVRNASPGPRGLHVKVKDGPTEPVTLAPGQVRDADFDLEGPFAKALIEKGDLEVGSKAERAARDAADPKTRDVLVLRRDTLRAELTEVEDRLAEATASALANPVEPPKAKDDADAKAEPEVKASPEAKFSRVELTHAAPERKPRG